MVISRHLVSIYYKRKQEFIDYDTTYSGPTFVPSFSVFWHTVYVVSNKSAANISIANRYNHWYAIMVDKLIRQFKAEAIISIFNFCTIDLIELHW